MNIRSMPLSLAALAIALTISACGDDGPTGGGAPDTTPPAVASVTALDRYHIEVVFNEPVTRFSAENAFHYWITEPALPVNASAAAPGDPIDVVGSTLGNDEQTVTITTSSIMSDVEYELRVEGVRDVQGNMMAGSSLHMFMGSSAADVTTPQILSRSPAPDATNVPVGVPVVVQFTENVGVGTATWISGGNSIDNDHFTIGDTFTMLPDDLLEPGSHHSVTLTGVQDASGNVMPDIQWSFTITSVADTTPPRLVSSVPANLATNVNVHTNISLTFSEPLHPRTRWVTILPPLEVFVLPFLENGGRTLTFETDSLLVDNQQYTIVLEPYYIQDLSGNFPPEFVTITFSTGSTLESGSIAGTIAGDPGTGAADPTGASVLAEGYSNWVTGTVAANNTYRLTHLADDVFELTAVKDANDDGRLDFYLGDAMGAYGVDLDLYDMEPDSVEISGGTQINEINFPIYDPSAVWGRLEYSGVHGNENFEYIGLFRTEGFDPQNPDPGLLVAVTDAYQDYPWFLNSLSHGIPDGTYYLAAYIDVGDDGLDTSIDPYNWYGGPGAPIPLHLANGSDVGDIVIPLFDPAPAMASTKRGAAWRVTKQNATFKHLGDVVRRSQQRTSKYVSE